jgi:hypothetical protein
MISTDQLAQHEYSGAGPGSDYRLGDRGMLIVGGQPGLCGESVFGFRCASDPHDPFPPSLVRRSIWGEKFPALTSPRTAAPGVIRRSGRRSNGRARGRHDDDLADQPVARPFCASALGIQREFWGETVFDFKHAFETRLTRSF